MYVSTSTKSTQTKLLKGCSAYVFTSNRVLSWKFPLQRELSTADVSRFPEQLQYKAPACHGDCAHAHETIGLCIIYVAIITMKLTCNNGIHTVQSSKLAKQRAVQLVGEL